MGEQAIPRSGNNQDRPFTCSPTPALAGGADLASEKQLRDHRYFIAVTLDQGRNGKST